MDKKKAMAHIHHTTKYIKQQTGLLHRMEKVAAEREETKALYTS